MRILGMEITFGKASKADQTYTLREHERDMEKWDKLARQAVVAKGIRTVPRMNIMSKIIFPEPTDPNDLWSCQQLAKLIMDVEKMFSRGYIDICVIRTAISDLKLTMTPESNAAFERLQTVHCVHFSDLLPGIFEQIPDQLTCVFTEGRYPEKRVPESHRLTQE